MPWFVTYDPTGTPANCLVHGVKNASASALQYIPNSLEVEPPGSGPVDGALPAPWQCCKVDTVATPPVVVPFSDTEKIPQRLKQRIADVQRNTEVLRQNGFVHGDHVHNSDADAIIGYMGLEKAKGTTKFATEVADNGPVPLPGVSLADGSLTFCMLTTAADVTDVYDAIQDREFALRIGELRLVLELATAASVSLAALEAVVDTRS